MTGWWSLFTRLARPQAGGFVGLLVLATLTAGIEAVKPWPMKLLIDSSLGDAPLPLAASWITSLPGAGGRRGLLVWLAAGTVLLLALLWLVRMADSYLRSGVGSRISYALGVELFQRLQRMSMRFHGEYPTGDLVRRVTGDSQCARDLAIGVGLPLLTATAQLGVMIWLMLELDARLTLVALAGAPLLLWSLRKLSGPMTELNYEHLTTQGALVGLAERTLSGMPVVQAFGREDDEQRSFDKVLDQSGRAYLRTIRSQLQFQFSIDGTAAMGSSLVLMTGAYWALGGGLTVGALVVFLSYVQSLFAPLNELASSTRGYSAARAAVRRVMEVLRSSDEIRDQPGALILAAGKVRGKISFENVTFGYEPNRPVLESVSFQLEPGQTVAFVGASGAGKTTLAMLLLRLFDPWQGYITLDGVDLRRIKIDSLRTQVAIMLQEPFLLPLSVAANIAYGRPGASMQEIRKAAEAARADTFIERLPQSYDTVLDERGANLSGGERQRIAIARALLKDAPVLILDEPTSALDAHTEAAIFESLQQLMEGRTTFIIAHRLWTIQRADHIVVLDRGRVVEQGRHEDLVNWDGGYKRLQELQPSTGRLRVT